MPDILICPFKAAEADAGTKQTLTTPHVAGCHLQFPHPLGFRVVHFKFHCFLHIGFQKVFEQVAFFILETQKDMDDFFFFLFWVFFIVRCFDMRTESDRMF